MGLLLLASGVLLALLRRTGPAVYAVLLFAVVVWALWEVSPDRWALVPRGAVLGLIGLWLMTPWVGRSLTNEGDRGAPERSRWSGSRGWLACAVVLVVVTALGSMLRDPFDVAGEFAAASVAPAAGATVSADDWLAYGGTGYAQRYSSLTGITPQNVEHLKLAWTFHTGDRKGPDDPVETTFEVTPLKVGDALYLCMVHDHVIALDATTSRQRWQFDPKIKVGHTSQHLSCRGLGYHD